MFPPDVVDWLQSNQHAGYAAHIAGARANIESCLLSIGVDLSSELAYLYINYGTCPVKGWYELNEVESIAEWTQYAQRELEVPNGFLALTAVEGQGIVLFDKGTGAIFDVEFGQFDELVSGSLRPIAGSVVEYLRWCRQRHVDSSQGIHFK